MMVLWHFYWPAVLAALIVGVIAGRYGFRREVPAPVPGQDAPQPAPAVPARRRKILLSGLAAAVLITGAWHFARAAGQFVNFVETSAAAELRHQEMTTVTAKLERAPLRRTLLLQGSADDFQRSELVRIMRNIPGASTGRWISPPLGSSALLPLVAEAELLALVGFLLGMLLSFLLELRRRSNAQWRW